VLRLDGEKFVPQGGDAQPSLRRSRVEIVLRPERFLFRPLELPGRAAEFLEGIIRSQVDRLTPWSAAEAAFGHTAPIDAGDGRVSVTIAATAKNALSAWLRAAADAGARSVKLSTRVPDSSDDGPTIAVLDQSGAALDKPRLRRLLLVGAVAIGLLTALTLTGASFLENDLQGRQDELARRIAERRSSILAARGSAGSPAAAAERALAKRKSETPSPVIALEALSRTLPDHTYVTELRIEGDRLRVTGLTRDAPSLIRLMEQSKHFPRASFFAPTTRGPNDVADRFHIETRVVPVFSGL
jgi:general secretion pathway protein L